VDTHRPGEARGDLPYRDRRHAGLELASRLLAYRDRHDVVVLGLARGGVPVAYEVAAALHAPLDIFFVKKLGAPGYPELAIGAVASGGIRVLNHDVIRQFGLSEQDIDAAIQRGNGEVARREREYGSGRPPPEMNSHIVILVDDGLATGATMRAAVDAVRTRLPARIVVAVPVGAPETCRELEHVAEEVVCARSPRNLSAVGLWYRDFTQTGDDEIRALMAAHQDGRHPQR
jgi:predicted phosphoribosyltransferase